MKFNIIVAKSSNDVIGDSKSNNLLWKIKKEMKYFKQITCDSEEYKKNVIIMGYNTWKSLPKESLPGRLNFIIDRDYRRVVRISEELFFGPSFDIIMEYINKTDSVRFIVDKIFLIGGGRVYHENIKHPLLDKLYVTNIKKKFQGDITFPKLTDNYQLISGHNDEEGEYKMEFLVYKYTGNHRHEEYQYIDIIKEIHSQGQYSPDRTGVGTYSVFGRQFKWDCSITFPLLTTKRMYFKGIVEELLWFLRGETDNKELQDRKVHIWDGNSSRDFLDSRGLKHLKEGDIGKSYGFQFRHFGGEYVNCNTDYSGIGYDQFQSVLDLIKNDPYSRRIIISLWNPCDLSEMALPPCLFFYQFRVYGKRLDLHILNRSNDMALGHPWNIATGALMLYIVSHMTDKTPGYLIHSISDAHLYSNHMDAIKEQFDRKPFSFPLLNIKNRGQKDIKDYKYSDFELIGYEAYPSIKMEMAV